jgi:hypothetical protein
MDKKPQQIFYTEHYRDVPNVFHNTDTLDIFRECTICGRELIDSNSSYIIEKAIKNYPASGVKDIIFEYAMCTTCMEKMRESFSSESLEKVNQYILDRTDLMSRRENFVGKGELDIDKWIASCIVNGKSTDELPEYQIMCQCQGKHMLFTHMPYMISCDATEEMQELLSQKTKDELQRFYDQYVGLPPELREIFNSRLPVL